MDCNSYLQRIYPVINRFKPSEIENIRKGNREGEKEGGGCTDV